jgi:archaellum biogenesis ATPase FlaH
MIKTTDGILTDEEKLEIEISKNSKLYHSNITSLNEIGIAPKGELTTVLAPKGMGKTTFIKTIIAGAAANKLKTLIILSEEKVARYKEIVCENFYKHFDKEFADERLKYLSFTSMIDWGKQDKSMEMFLAFIDKEVREKNYLLVILDNFNTSFFSDLSISKQGEAIQETRRLAGLRDIALMVVFHTTKGLDIHDKMIDGEDVRGNATSTNTAGYNLVLTTYFRLKPVRTVLHIDKARYHPKMNKTYWELIYDETRGLFTHDKKLTPLQADQLRKAAKEMK